MFFRKINKRNIRLKTAEHPKVELHPKSYCEKIRDFESPFLAYHLILKSSSIYIHDATMVYPMPLLFFGERLDIIDEGKGSFSIRVDGMIKFNCFKKTGLLVQVRLLMRFFFITHKITTNKFSVLEIKKSVRLDS